jgi:hypothetical protein
MLALHLAAVCSGMERFCVWAGSVGGWLVPWGRVRLRTRLWEAVENCKLGLRAVEQAMPRLNNTGVSPLRRARSRAAPVEMTGL